MKILDDMKMYGRFAWGLRHFLRDTITLEQARATVQRLLARRESNFLRLVERGIFNYPLSPYLPLLKMAGCELGDIQNMVHDKGLEDTLLALREAGVYITFEEFKGREPIVRHGQVFPVQSQNFDNPYLKRHYYSESGGTTGAGTRVAHDLDHLAVVAAHEMLLYHANQALDAPKALWRGVMPDGSGINNLLRLAHFGCVPQRWFSQLALHDLGPSLLKYRLATQFTVVIGRLSGISLPWPEGVRLDQAFVVARWAAETLQTHGTCLITASVSRAVRVCVSAREEGLDLSGVTFRIAGEAITPAKVRHIERTGAKIFTHYGFAEAGRIAMGCSRPKDSSDLHLCKGVCAIIQYPRLVIGTEITVPAFNVTSLLPTTPKILLNTESDDYGVIEKRSCGCPLEVLGTEHLREIRSFRKLTAEGVTLVGSEMVHILEEVLPSRFGGSPLDYQLLEEEDEEGFTRLNLLVSPKLKIPDEEAVVEVVLSALGQSSVAADCARTIWSQAGTLQVKRMEPIWTERGKLMPLHVKRHTEN